MSSLDLPATPTNFFEVVLELGDGTAVRWRPFDHPLPADLLVTRLSVNVFESPVVAMAFHHHGAGYHTMCGPQDDDPIEVVMIR